MSKRRGTKNDAANHKRRSTTRSLGAALLALTLGGIAFFLWPSPPPLPLLDLSEMAPQVAAKVEEHVEAVRQAGDSPDAWGELGVVLQAHRRDVEAAQCYREAIARDARNFRWQYLLVHALRSTDAKAAIDQTVVALSVDPAYSPLHVVRGELLEEQGDIDGAQEHYRRAVELDPESAMAAFGAGRQALAHGEIEEALVLLERAAELDPEAGSIHASLSQAYRRLGERDKAIAEARIAGELHAAVGIADPIHFRMRRESVSSLAQHAEAVAAAESGDLVRAETIFRGLVELRPDDADIRAQLGDVLAEQNRLAPAKSEYETALELNPDHASAHYGLGNMLNLEGDYSGAIEHYRSAASLRADHLPTLVNLGSLLAFDGKEAEAESVFLRALEIDETAFGPHRQLGSMRLKQKRFDEAVEHFTAALEARPESGRVHFQLAIALASLGEFSAALSHASEAERLGETLPPGLKTRLEQNASS